MAQGQQSTVEAPDVLPSNFFDQKNEAPDTLPGDFFEKKQASGPDDLTKQAQAAAKAAGASTAPESTPKTPVKEMSKWGALTPPGLQADPVTFNPRYPERSEMLGAPVAPAGAAASFPRAAAGLASGYGAAKVLKNQNPWVRDAGVIGAGLLGEGLAAQGESIYPAVKRATYEPPEKINLGPFGKINRNAPPPRSITEQADRTVERQIAIKAARVRAGLEPPAEDTIAEVLRNEILSPPKKSGVPQEISSPRARTPTYVPAGTPGAPAPKFAETPAPEPPAVSKLSEGPTALQHQVARQNALQDIRNATINRPGWVSKLPDRVEFEKMSPAEQREAIQEAITKDPEAVKAVRANARQGSAGDLATWTKEDLWAHYMKQYTSPTPDEDFKNSLAEEIKRRAQAEAAPHSVRP